MCLLLLLGVTVTTQAETIDTIAGEAGSTAASARTRSTFTFRNGEIHTRTVENINGHAIAEGDMIVGNAEDFFSHPDRRTINGLSNNSYGQTWPNGVVPYYINTDLSDSVVEKIQSAIDHWNSIGAVTLVERTQLNSALYPDYIDFVDANRCASWIGYQATGPQKIYTGDYCSAGSMIHEIGHALGLLHEHTRPDRDNFVRIHWDRIETDMELNFEIISGGVALGSYDYGSIMHYGPTFFSNDGRPTIEAIQSTTATIGQRVTTSAGDRKSIAELYKSNLSLVASAASSSVNAGNPVDVTLYVTNNSSIGANTLQAVMPVPAGSTLLSYSASHWTCSQAGTGADVTCDSPVLEAGAATSVAVRVSTSSTAGQLFLDTTLNSRTMDSNTADNHDSVVVTVLGNSVVAQPVVEQPVVEQPPVVQQPVIAAAEPDNNQISAPKLVQQQPTGGSAGGGGAFSWLSFSFLLILFPFIPFGQRRH
ncbi:hypothetical protein AB833_20345 [Chromatiales bacterium (ex Bugula neritina AB1)]|nr:hypothetical protein AB833_20345 [Chromatiales bacterium (ex Bugula neritina AB1)]